MFFDRVRLVATKTALADPIACCAPVRSPRFDDGQAEVIAGHMKILFEAGLITRDKRGLWVWYRIVPERLDALRAVLA
jgi:ArsR family transcriptional regulator